VRGGISPRRLLLAMDELLRMGCRQGGPAMTKPTAEQRIADVKKWMKFMVALLNRPLPCRCKDGNCMGCIFDRGRLSMLYDLQRRLVAKRGKK
jgi:hypothetical protein